MRFKEIVLQMPNPELKASFPDGVEKIKGKVKARLPGPEKTQK